MPDLYGTKKASLVKRARSSEGRRAGGHWMLAGFLVFAALIGGSARPDVLSLVILRPAAILACAWGAWKLSGDALRRHRFAFGMIAATILLAAIHLVPLPPAVWQALPGRALVAEIGGRTELGPVWRPISLTPDDTRNALFSLSVPLAVLLLGAELRRPALERLLLVMVAVGLVSGFVGLLQLLGPPTGPLYLYRQTNYGAATGLFANRNHQAIFLATLFPMLAALVTTRRGTLHATRDAYGALAAGIFLIPLLLVTGSRAGVVLGAAGLLSVPALLRLETRRERRGRATVPLSGWRRVQSPRALITAGALLAVGLAALTIGLSRAESVTRLIGVGADEELRFKVWPVILATIPTYFPVGSGIGSFVQVFQVVEPDRILRPTYLNHAHNDVLEVLLTAGLPGAALLLVALAGWAVAARRAFATGIDGADGVLFARLGVVLIGLLALGSVGDYPLRTPFLAAALSLATLWSGGLGRGSSK